MNGLAGGTGARLYLVTMAVCMGCKTGVTIAPKALRASCTAAKWQHVIARISSDWPLGREHEIQPVRYFLRGQPWA